MRTTHVAAHVRVEITRTRRTIHTQYALDGDKHILEDRARPSRAFTSTSSPRRRLNPAHIKSSLKQRRLFLHASAVSCIPVLHLMITLKVHVKHNIATARRHCVKSRRGRARGPIGAHTARVSESSLAGITLRLRVDLTDVSGQSSVDWSLRRGRAPGTAVPCDVHHGPFLPRVRLRRIVLVTGGIATRLANPCSRANFAAQQPSEKFPPRARKGVICSVARGGMNWRE